MMDALTLVNDLSRQGVRFGCGSQGMTLTGDLARLAPDYKQALRSNLPAVETLVRWKTLQDEAEARFGCPEARLYPFLRLDILNAPIVRTTLGKARLVRVVVNGCDVVLESDLSEWRQDCAVAEKTLPLPAMVRLELDGIHPPTTSPKEAKS